MHRKPLSCEFVWSATGVDTYFITVFCSHACTRIHHCKENLHLEVSNGMMIFYYIYMSRSFFNLYQHCTLLRWITFHHFNYQHNQKYKKRYRWDCIMSDMNILVNSERDSPSVCITVSNISSLDILQRLIWDNKYVALKRFIPTVYLTYRLAHTKILTGYVKQTYTSGLSKYAVKEGKIIKHRNINSLQNMFAISQPILLA